MTTNETIKKHNDIYDFSELKGLKGLKGKEFSRLLAIKINKLIKHTIFTSLKNDDEYDIHYETAANLIDWIDYGQEDLNKQNEDIVNAIGDIQLELERCEPRILATDY